ncbi:MAG: endonuclease/exonuclease/phosphatase family protein [Chitinophagales bacterium]
MVRSLFVYINIFLAILLLLSGWSIYLNPTTFWLPALLGLGYPFLLVLNLAFIFIWLFLFKRKKAVFISLISIMLTWSSFTSIFNISAAARSTGDVSLMTWNVKNFDLYNWSENEETHELMMQLLEQEKPDILCIQEFYTETKGKFKNIKEIKQRLGYKYYYFGETFSVKNGTKKWGLVTFSKFPIKDHGIISFDSGARLNACIFTDIEYKKDSLVRVYNTHLQSLHFADEDYKYLSEIKDDKKTDLESSKKILKKLKAGFEKRSTQAEKIKAHANSFEGKKIICGDFNDTPTSYTHQVLSEGLCDAFKEKGVGFGKTLVNPSPFFRIDFILATPCIDVNSYETFSKKYSDHYPVKAFLELN